MRNTILSLVGLLAFVGLLVATAAATLPAPEPFALTVTPYADLMRFVVESDAVKELRLEVFGLSGHKLFDSGFQPGHALDWKMQDSHGGSVGNGVYLYAVTVKDKSGNVSRRLNKLVLLRRRQGLAATSPLALPNVSEPPFDIEPPIDIEPGPEWSVLLGSAERDNLSVIRWPITIGRQGRRRAFTTLLQVEADGKVRVRELCLGATLGELMSGGECFGEPDQLPGGLPDDDRVLWEL